MKGKERLLTRPGSLRKGVGKPALQRFLRFQQLLQQAGLLWSRGSVKCCQAWAAQQAVGHKVLGAAAEIAVPLLQALCASRQQSLGRLAEGCDERCRDPCCSAGRVIAAAAAAAAAVAAPFASAAWPPALDGMRQRPATMTELARPGHWQNMLSALMHLVLECRGQTEEERA